MCKLSKLLTGNAKPSDIIPRSSITVDALGNIRIDLSHLNIPFTVPPEVWIPSTAATKSMLPSFGAGHNNFFLQAANIQNQRILVDWLGEETAKGLRMDPYLIRDEYILYVSVGIAF